MTLQEFINLPTLKFAVVGLAEWQADEVAKSIAPAPRQFTLDGTEFVILSLEPLSIDELASYIEANGAGVEFGFIRGSGKASFLTLEQAIDLLKGVETDVS